jgi:hypothetical protein
MINWLNRFSKIRESLLLLYDGLREERLKMLILGPSGTLTLASVKN